MLKRAIKLLDFSNILVDSIRLVVVLMHIRARNSTSPCRVEAGHGHMRLTATLPMKHQQSHTHDQDKWLFLCWPNYAVG